MLEVRFHGRGGQGAVTAAELLAQAAISEGKYAQGFPNFGAERRGAPVTAFLRVSDTPIYTRERILSPNAVVVLDHSLLDLPEISAGFVQGGDLIVNMPSGRDTSGMKALHRVSEVDATAIAVEFLGVPIANTAIIGALVRATGLVELASLEEPIRHRFGRLAEKNLGAVKRAFQETRTTEAPKPRKDVRGQEAQEEFTVEAVSSWQELEIGGDILEPGNSASFLTGNWRTTGKPVTDMKKCIKCGLCWIVCPDMAYRRDLEGFFLWDGRYCKGCAICVTECPKKAIEVRSEQ